MAATITFRPKPEQRAALAARMEATGMTFTAQIHAALDQYLGLGMGGETSAVGAPARSGDESQTSEVQDRPRPRRPKAARARQGVPSPADAVEPECPHPKAAEKKLGFGVQCTECGKIIR